MKLLAYNMNRGRISSFLVRNTEYLYVILRKDMREDLAGKNLSIAPRLPIVTLEKFKVRKWGKFLEKPAEYASLSNLIKGVKTLEENAESIT